MMYEKIKNQLIAENEKYRTNAIQYATDNESTLKRYSTATRWNQYVNGIISREKCIEYATKRINAKYNKSLEKDLEKLETIARAENIKSISVSVTWHKSRTWGYNPVAEIRIETDNRYYYETGTASGCGYDKKSAAVGSALNKIPAALKLLCDLKDVNAPENITEYSNGKYIAYGAGYGAIPYYEGGVGYNCFDNIFNIAGFKRVCFNETKTTDYYYYEKA